MKKYTHPLTKELTPSSWRDRLDLDRLSLDDLIAIYGDMKSMERLAKHVGGYLREILTVRLPEDEYATKDWRVIRQTRTRTGTLDKDKIIEEYGEEWLEPYLREPTEYTELRIGRITEQE